MANLDWHRIEAAFFAVMEQPAAERGRTLDRHCARDVALRTEVAALLATLDAEPDFLESPFAGLPGADDTPPREPAAPGEAVGPYRIVRPLARGGMGEVYLAARADDFRQHVALKVIRRGLETDDVLRRFAAERQILAELHHPNIAALLDGGATADGRPYFAMEYVDGRPITEYADARRLTVDDRLQLVRTVCTAVHHAHQRLVVHRDIKPSNVLVTDDGLVKLLDFGIAKLLAPRALEVTTALEPLSTGGEHAPLTPAYAAPEQHAGGPITVATDVYGLGALTFELLTGQRPVFRHDGPHASPALPHRPSMVAHTSTRVEEVAAARRTRPDRHSRRLAGDLDLILLRALHPDPEQRYPSAEALSDDIDRHRRGHTVRARPDTLGYRARRFIGRHPTGISMTLAVALLLIGFSATTAIQSAHVRAHAETVARERDTAEQLADFLVGLFRGSTPAEAQGATLSARDLLERGTARIDAELGDRPEVQARLLTAVGEAYAALGLFEPAMEVERRAVDLSMSAEGENSVMTAASMTALATTLRRMGAYDEAEQLHRRALAVRRDLLGPGHPDVAASLHNLAVVLRAVEQDDQAEAAYLEALAIRRSALGDRHATVASTLTNMSALFRAAGRYEEAEEGYREALAIRRDALGGNHPDVAATLSRLGLLLKEKGDYADAEPMLHEALEIRRRVLPPAHPDLSHTLGSLALLRKDRGDLDGAEPLLREALEIRRDALGHDHPAVAVDMHNLARLYHDQRRYDEAEVILRESLAIARRAHGEDHSNVALVRQSLGWLLVDRGQLAAAEAELVRALATRRRVFGEQHQEVAQSLSTLALLHRTREEYQRSKDLYAEALVIYEKSLGERHAYTAAASYNLALVSLELGETVLARPLFERALAVYAATLPAESERSAQAAVGLGRTFLAQNEPRLAEPLLRSALANLRASAGERSPRTAEARAALGISLAALDQTTEAANHLRIAIPDLTLATSSKPLARQATAVLAELTGGQ